MSKRDKLIDRVLNKPINFEYDEARGLLEKFSYKEDNRGTVKQDIS